MARFVGSCDRSDSATGTRSESACGPLVPQAREDAGDSANPFVTSMEGDLSAAGRDRPSPPLQLEPDPRGAVANSAEAGEAPPASTDTVRTSSSEQRPIRGAEVTCMAFLEPYPAIVVGDSAGRLQVWTIPPHPARCHMVATWTRQSLDDPEETPGASSRSPAITCMSLTRINPRRHTHAASALGKEHLQQCDSVVSSYSGAGLGGRRRESARPEGRAGQLWGGVKSRLGEGVAFLKRAEVSRRGTRRGTLAAVRLTIPAHRHTASTHAMVPPWLHSTASSFVSATSRAASRSGRLPPLGSRARCGWSALLSICAARTTRDAWPSPTRTSFRCVH